MVGDQVQIGDQTDGTSGTRRLARVRRRGCGWRTIFRVELQRALLSEDVEESLLGPALDRRPSARFVWNQLACYARIVFHFAVGQRPPVEVGGLSL